MIALTPHHLDVLRGGLLPVALLDRTHDGGEAALLGIDRTGYQGEEVAGDQAGQRSQHNAYPGRPRRVDDDVVEAEGELPDAVGVLGVGEFALELDQAD